MESRKQFVNRVQQALSLIDPIVLLYNENEFWLIQQPYEYLENYAVSHRLLNTAVALPLARGLHNGVYRKFSVEKGGGSYRIPYYIHCLRVCCMLADIYIPLASEDEDCLLASAICHDLIEDIPFSHGGRELTEEFGLDPSVYETVKLLSKRNDFTRDEEIAYFENIQANPLALLVKLADRGNNVEDLYNMSPRKLKEYMEETETYFLPMIQYGLSHYPELSIPIHILQNKIITLTNVSRALIGQLERRNQGLREQRDGLKLENQKLREAWKHLWEEEMDHEE